MVSSPPAMPVLSPTFWSRFGLDKKSYRTYVETGSYRGAGIREVLGEYDAIHSIELSKRWHDHCVAEFARHDHVRLHLGDSTELLATVLDDIDEPAVIFLDAHYSGGSTARGARDTPLLDELEILGRRAYPDIVIIDDTGFLGQKGGREPAQPAPEYESWPEFAYDWSETTREAVLARLKPGYAVVANEDCSMTTSPRDDQYILVPTAAHERSSLGRESATAHEKAFFTYAERTRRRARRFEAPAEIEKRSARTGALVRSYGLGFRKTTLDPVLLSLLRRRLESNLHRLEREADDVFEFIRNVETGAPLVRVHRDAEFDLSLLRALKPMHEEWCGFPLIESACHGIRVYQRGDYLFERTDVPETHVISSMICVGRDTEDPWPVSVEGTDGRQHDVDLAPGEMLFYERARLHYARPYPLQSAYYAGIYLHYRPADGDPPATRQ
jgi:hypothetical protein